MIARALLICYDVCHSLFGTSWILMLLRLALETKGGASVYRIEHSSAAQQRVASVPQFHCSWSLLTSRLRRNSLRGSRARDQVPR